jgi:hypothetical protein
VPEVIEQLEAWALEFDEKASRIEERAAVAEPLAAGCWERRS